MIPVTELRQGKTFEEEGQPYIVLEYIHTKMGRGTANINVHAKNLLTGSVVRKTYISGAKVEDIVTPKKKLQFLYKTGDIYTFMNPKTYEQVELSGHIIKDQTQYLKEGEEVEIMFWEEIPLAIILPPKMQFSVAETGPGLKGNSATNVFKDAVLDNGLQTRIPLFIDKGEKIWVDTRNGEYVERVK